MDFPRGGSPHWLRLEALAQTGVVIFGAGAGGHILHEFFTRKNVPVKAFLDNYKYGHNCLGVKVFPASSDPALLGVPAETPAIISVVNFSSFGNDNAESCREQLKKGGWLKVSTRQEWLAVLFFENQKHVHDVNRMWADEKSRTLYAQALKFLATRDMEHEPSTQSQTYFPSDVPTMASPLRWIQGGAYTGDSLAEALALKIQSDEAAFFEPDQASFSQLVSKVRNSGVKAACWPCGLWKKTEALRFTSGQGADSAVDPDGDILIQGVDLDSALPNFAPSLITLDVEGAEINALEGMKDTIVRNRPNLAISIYHRPDDWWEIPNWLKNLERSHNLNYGYYLRIHDHLATDAIMYVVRNMTGTR